MPSLTEIAKAAGVSITTASMVLNRTRQINRVSASCAERVRAVADQLGYVPNYHARSMKLGRAEMLGVALDVGFLGKKAAVVSELGISYFGQLIGAMELTARNAGFGLTIVGPDQNHRAPDRGVDGMKQRRFDGLIVAGAVVRTELTRFFETAPDFPIVVVESPVPTELPTIDFDQRQSMRLAVGHLSELGHRRLLWVQVGTFGNSDPRQDLFVEAAREAGLRYTKLIVPDPIAALNGNVGGQIDAVEAELLRHLSAKPDRPWTAVVAFNDVVGIGVCSALARAGIRVPADVSVMGFDDVESRLCIPRLTSVSHRLPYMGALAAKRVMEMINDDGAASRLRGTVEVIQPELIVRASTGPVPA